MLSIGDIVASSWRDAWTTLKTYRTAVYVCLILAAIAGIVGIFPAMGGSPQAHANGMMIDYDTPGLLISILSFFALAAAVRTIRSGFAITVGRFFGILGYSILVGIIVAIGNVFLLIPGIWFYGKLTLTPVLYCLYDDSPLAKSWNTTTHRFWQTWGLVLLVGIIAGILLSIGFGIAALVVNYVPFLGIVFAPAVVLLAALLTQFQWLALVRWAHNLVEHPAAEPMVATA